MVFFQFCNGERVPPGGSWWWGATSRQDSADLPWCRAFWRWLRLWVLWKYNKVMTSHGNSICPRQRLNVGIQSEPFTTDLRIEIVTTRKIKKKITKTKKITAANPYRIYKHQKLKLFSALATKTMCSSRYQSVDVSLLIWPDERLYHTGVSMKY